MTDLRQDTRDAFAEIFGRHADGVWSAPGRVNLIGEHTDYNEGFVLPFAINRRTVVALGAARRPHRPRRQLVRRRARRDRPRRRSGPRRSRLVGLPARRRLGARRVRRRPARRARLRHPHRLERARRRRPVVVRRASRAPSALALNDVWQLGLDRRTLAAVGQLAENEAVGAPDRHHGPVRLAARPSTTAAVFLDCRSLDAEIVPLGLRGRRARDRRSSTPG